MALRHIGASPKNAEPGDILLVIHDFEARSPDELSLQKGDKIELIERDDDFGDGWYLGRHIQNEKTGLFPEVYTTTTPRTINVSANTTAMSAKSVVAPPANVHTNDVKSIAAQNLGATSLEQLNPDAATPPPLNTTPPSQRTGSAPSTSSTSQVPSTGVPPQRSISLVQQTADGESPVMNETLSVIDEHITDMKAPRQNGLGHERRSTNESGSVYSSHIDQRLSYIAGHETDEEERNMLTEREIIGWTPAQVAEHLEDIGVEKRHCETFKEQEISGEVLMAMDQPSIFMKEFDLGPVGRRLRTWHKIKALQEEVRGPMTPPSRIANNFAIDDSSEEFETRQTRAATTGGSMIPSTYGNQATADRLFLRQEVPSPQQSPSIHQLQSQRVDSSSTPASFTYKSGFDSPGRPSAATIREFNHSRRHSAVDFAAPSVPATPPPDQRNMPTTLKHSATSPHKKTPSLDRNWTMGSAAATANGQTLSGTGSSPFTRTDRNTFDPHTGDSGHSRGASRDVDRGYSSGGELESRRARNVLRKRDAASTSHSRQSSYHTDRRVSAVPPKRHSRFGSVDSIKDTMAAVASPVAKAKLAHFRNSSANEPITTSTTSTDATSPTVTKLEYDSPSKLATSTRDLKAGPSINGSPKSPLDAHKSSPKPRIGLRAISDAVTGGEKAMVSTPSPTIKESARESPSRTGSTSPSAASQSIERESTDASSKGTSTVHTGLTPTSGTRRKKKTDTSAYVRGLEHKTPQEQMEGCDYSGWMKKRSSNIMTTWKPRLFILRGRRLSYYYSDSDIQEKGLIDISSHRVLPADHDILTGIHATVTGAKSSPVSPATSHTPTMASQDAAAQTESSIQKTPQATMFIFKLVPPRSGLSRAVNFTKPTVHYFAVESVTQGRLWMAALMKATIDRDETKPISTTYQQKTISLAKAKMLRHRPPALMNLEEYSEAVDEATKNERTGLNIQGVDCGKDEADSEHEKPLVAAEEGKPQESKET